MPEDARPIVYISYTWRKDDPDDPDEDPQARALRLADRLRDAGFQIRLDRYFHESLHGFVPPQLRPGDELAPWARWAGEQIREADFVLLVCGPAYAKSLGDSPLGGTLSWGQWHALQDDEKGRLLELQENGKGSLPYTWWDWHFMIRELESNRAQPRKFIPVGFGHHGAVAPYVPDFVKGANYYDLDSDRDFEALVRGMSARLQGRRRLIVVVPGLRDQKANWEPLKARLLQESELDGSEWFYWDHHILRSLGFRRAEPLARELKASIDEKWAGASGYDDVVLIGHSMGGLLVRQAYLVASGYPNGQRSRWHARVSKIVLFAATNRGFDPRRRLGMIGRLAGPLLRRTGAYSWLPFSDFLRGSDFITNMRIVWLRLFRSLEHRPVVVQLLGQHDTMVETLDSADVDQFPGGYQFDVPGANHSNVIRLDHHRDPDRQDARYRLIRDCILHPDRQAEHIRPTGIEPAMERHQVVFVLHGIRDSNNDWVQKARARIRARAPRVEVIAPNQGYLTLLEFLSPTRRRRPSRDLKDAYNECVTRYPDVEFHFLGHSNGTYQLGRALRDVPEMRFGRVVLAGSVLPPDYPWDERFRSGQVVELENHMSLKDLPVGYVCSALRAIGMRDLGTGGFTGFEKTGTGAYRPIAYYDGDHGAPVRPPALNQLVDHVLGLPSDPVDAPDPELEYLPSWRRRISLACSLFAPILVLAALGGLSYLLISSTSGFVTIAAVVAVLVILLALLLY
jgi:pimeloyl-ACP methyl ester carboxylesterase